MATLQEIADGYLKLREKRKLLKAKFDEIDNDLKDKLDKLEIAAMSKLEEASANSITVDGCTVYKQTSTKSSCGSWPDFWAFVQETGRFDMMEKRLSNKSIEQYLDETGDLPPGVSIHRESKAIFRSK